MTNEHLTAEQIQGLLDGRIPEDRARALRAHLDGCERCSTEMSALAGVFDALSGLGGLTPSAGFADRVLTVAVPELALRNDLLAAGHVTAEALIEYLDAGLTTAGHGVVERHLAACASCRAEEAQWSLVFRELGALERHAPSADFRQRVLDRLPARAAATTGLAARSTGRRAVGEIRAFVRHQVARVRELGRGRWAVVAGVGTAPAAVAGSIAWVVLSHPLVTMRGLFQFAWLQATQLVSAVGGPVLGVVVESAGTYQLWSLAQSLASTPWLILVGVVALCAALSTSVWVLLRTLGPIYRNLLPVRTTSGRYARANV